MQSTGTFCVKKSSTYGKGKWRDPPGVCTDCTCKWTGYTYCYGGCNQQKTYYEIRTADVSAGSEVANSKPNLEDLHVCTVATDVASTKQATCRRNSDNSIIHSDIQLGIRTITGCSCKKIGDAPLESLTASDITNAESTMIGLFASSSGVITTV